MQVIEALCRRSWRGTITLHINQMCAFGPPGFVVLDPATPSDLRDHSAARAALRASPPRPVTVRIDIEASMRCMPGPTWCTAIA
jgi:hypothetical protein